MSLGYSRCAVDQPRQTSCRRRSTALDQRAHQFGFHQPSMTAADPALDGWEDWALLHEQNNGINRWISLDAIRARINAAGLGMDADPPSSDTYRSDKGSVWPTSQADPFFFRRHLRGPDGHLAAASIRSPHL